MVAADARGGVKVAVGGITSGASGLKEAVASAGLQQGLTHGLAHGLTQAVGGMTEAAKEAASTGEGGELEGGRRPRKRVRR